MLCTRMWRRAIDRLAWEHKRFRQRRFISGLERAGVGLGQGAFIDRRAELRLESPIVIGCGTNVHRDCVFKGKEPISIGKYCEIAEGVHIISSNHAMNRMNLNLTVQLAVGAGRLFASKGPVTIGNNVWIGDNAIILSGTSIGDGAVVGAGSVVTGNVPSFTIVAGSPARPIRKRFDDQTITRLERDAWWDWTPEQMRANVGLFAADLTSERGISLLYDSRADEDPASSDMGM